MDKQQSDQQGNQQADKEQLLAAIKGFYYWIGLLPLDFYQKNVRTINSLRAILERELRDLQ